MVVDRDTIICVPGYLAICKELLMQIEWRLWSFQGPRRVVAASRLPLLSPPKNCPNHVVATGCSSEWRRLDYCWTITRFLPNFPCQHPRERQHHRAPARKVSPYSSSNAKVHPQAIGFSFRFSLFPVRACVLITISFLMGSINIHVLYNIIYSICNQSNNSHLHCSIYIYI